MKDLSMHILDIVQNSIRANARDIRICIDEKPADDQFIIRIDDNGCGMTAEELSKADNPFYTSRKTRRVGLGLSLLKQNAEKTDGQFSISSQPGQGTSVKAVFGFHHIDRPVLGDIAGTLLVLFSSSDTICFHYLHQTPGGKFSLNTAEIREMLGDIPFTHPEVRSFLMDYLSGNLNQIQISE